ncbi:MAG TPA: ABC transporter [Erysipelotrichaceae bacterium]|nr:ABC transporter [Erysipelotrichaceae bacterium]
MSAFIYGILLQWRLDLRNKGILLTYYVVPLVFFAFMGGIFTSINPAAKDTLIQSMMIFGVSMGAFLGTPTPLVDVFATDIKKAYRVGGIPLWTIVANNIISAFIHLSIMSMIILLTAPIIYKATVPTNLFVFFTAQSIFILASVLIGTVLGLFAKSSTKLTMISQLFFLPSIMVGGIMFPSSMLPKILQAAGLFFPATWGFKATVSNVFDFDLLWPMIVIMIGCCVISIWKTSRLNSD